MIRQNEEIIEAEFSVVADGGNDGVQEKHIWVLVGENISYAKLANICFRTSVDATILVNCYVLQIEGVDIKNAFDRRESKRFNIIPTKEEQKQMVIIALFKHQLEGEIWTVGERYAEGHKSVLKLQSRIKGGAHVSV